MSPRPRPPGAATPSPMSDPGAVPPGAASSVFAGYYLPGDPFGSVSLLHDRLIPERTHGQPMRKLILTLGATALLAVPAAASAADYTVTGGRLDWTMANQFESESGQSRTWLGYAIRGRRPGVCRTGRIESIAPGDADEPGRRDHPGAQRRGCARARQRPQRALQAQLPRHRDGDTLSTTSAGKLSAYRRADRWVHVRNRRGERLSSPGHVSSIRSSPSTAATGARCASSGTKIGARSHALRPRRGRAVQPST